MVCQTLSTYTLGHYTSILRIYFKNQTLFAIDFLEHQLKRVEHLPPFSAHFEGRWRKHPPIFEPKFIAKPLSFFFESPQSEAKQNNQPNIFPFFLFWRCPIPTHVRIYLYVLVTFPGVFFLLKQKTQNNTLPCPPPPFFLHSRKKMWPGKRRIFQSTFTKRKGHAAIHGVVFSLKHQVFFG